MSNEHRKHYAFLTGLALIACGVADAALNPFAFATAPQFFTAGAASIAVSIGKGGDDGKKR